ncbi:ankyrin repeat protein [Dendryphion nanum]|uniref:Ankyrin repeat protein n=1 Tax=Dendryphion nanum TaxID=256645 RepID=A0A9P9DV51_9PLEO|nr:ankyrin repeat protein [Dendryphion nanum]
MTSSISLPEVPAKHADFVSYVLSHPDTPLPKLLQPYKEYDAKLREIFAQEPENPLLNDKHLNVVPLFDPAHEHGIKIRARKLESESIEEKERYVMPLDEAARHEDGSPALVKDIREFQQNFALFCESSLVDLDWSNVVAAGSSVVTSLLPVPAKYTQSKRSLRQYYHETIAPASDVDLFLYGLSEEDAVKKIIEIEQRIKDSILTETTTIRTKNAITIASQYPTRHVQIVLRIYKSVAEILTGFDVDCSCAAYDGKQVYAAPRAITAYMSQTNTIDLSRRSPSYENRLSKYSHRGFEVYWPLLERSKIDPTIYERNFGRTVGLARLLVLERLPTKSERESYMDERRRERGRPAIDRSWRHTTTGNIKDAHEDEVAEWVEQDDVSDYHTFTIPYGPHYHAKRIEKLLYTKDLLLNAEWNKKDDREVYLHRHPAFFGYAEDVIHDCCGFCPKPITDEDHVVAEEEAKIYVSGEISFLKDDPGRQAIGSFNPITDDDWTEMAYVGNTARLCQAIIDEDLEHVEDWLAQEESDPNTRDYTGRTPLHLAVTTSTPEIVQALINRGARLVARLADGRTALHLAAARGNVEIVRAILQKSEENEEEEAKKEDARKEARIAARENKSESTPADKTAPAQDSEDSDIDMVDVNSDTDVGSATTGSYFKVKESEKEKSNEEKMLDEDDEPDVYDVNVLSWDTQTSPLHFAILNGHIDVVKELVQNFGADVLLPIKLLNRHDRSPRGAILTLVLALRLPIEQAKAMTKTLLNLGASSAQADMKQTTALHCVSGEYPELLDILVENDEPAAKRAINHLSVVGSYWHASVESPFMSAIKRGNVSAALKLLEIGANPTIDFKAWLRSKETQDKTIRDRDSKRNHQDFLNTTEQPVMLAVQFEMPELVVQLVNHGVGVNTVTKETQSALEDEYRLSYTKTETLLDAVRSKIKELDNYSDNKPPKEEPYRLKKGKDYLVGIESGSYKEFIVKIKVEEARKLDERDKESYETRLKNYQDREGVKEKEEAIKSLAARFRATEQELLAKGAKTFDELHPGKKGKNTEYGGFNRNYSPREIDNSYKVEFDFDVHDLTDETREGYLALFDAAWNNDLSTIKTLTLATWGPEKDRTPLKIAVEDRSSQSPFSIAVLRGHYDTARAIVEISYIQYEPEEDTERARYRMANDGDEDELDSDEEIADVPVIKELVDDKFTIENIGEVSSTVKSRVLPDRYILWSCSAWQYNRIYNGDEKYTYGLDNNPIPYSDRAITLREWAIITGNDSLFALMLDLDVEYTDRVATAKAEPEGDSPSSIPWFSEVDFLTALEYGNTKFLAEMIKHAGAGMNLETLVKKSGVKYKEKPKFYQGLSVHGKKRADWVSAARGTSRYKSADSSYSPLLRAAFDGSLVSVEWFMSATPSRHYLDFAEAYKHEKLIAHLNTLGGGFEKVLFKWLNSRRELALHCAVLATPGPETTKLLQYLLKIMPDSLEIKSMEGHTPLALAFSLRRYEAAKLLLDAGADQTTRDAMGRNILHLLFTSAYTNSKATEEHHIERMFPLVDTRLISSLLRERCSEDPGSLTPLALFLRNSFDSKVLHSILDFAEPTGNEHLVLLDGSGETILHNAVKRTDVNLINILLTRRPDLLYRENSVGRTPYEVAKDAYTAEVVASAPNVTSVIATNIINRSHYEFQPNYEPKRSVSYEYEERTWQACERVMKTNPGKRHLVSLLDANEVADRLAKRHAGRKTVSGDDAASDASSVCGEESGFDEIATWYRAAVEEKE